MRTQVWHAAVVEPDPIRLFSYGTLQQPEVQAATFGRPLQGSPDALTGHTTRLLEITDPEVVRVSGSAWHPVVVATGSPADEVEGTVFAITAQDLAAADEYEVGDYARSLLTLRSGEQAWVYLAAGGS